MKMGAGKAEPASAVGPFDRPGDVLRLAALDRFAHFRVALVRAIFSAQGAWWRDGSQDWRDPIHAFAKTHIEIPFVMDREGLDAARDRMLGQRFEVRIPMWVDGSIDLETAADPI